MLDKLKTLGILLLMVYLLWVCFFTDDSKDSPEHTDLRRIKMQEQVKEVRP